MSVLFNHTILSTHDGEASAAFLSEVLGLPDPVRWGPFWMVRTDNGANLDYMNVEHDIVPQHYAFLVDEAAFDAILDRVQKRVLPHWSDPARVRHGVNHHDGGRGVYFDDPNGHLLELITRPYGSGGWNP